MPESSTIEGNGTIGDRGHPDTALSYSPVMFNQAIGYFSILTQSLETARPDHSISQLQPRNFSWRENLALYFCWHCASPCPVLLKTKWTNNSKI
jgi:hypothetical protein